MTEAQFQKTRKVMQTANYIRGQITHWKGDVARWTNIEASHRENMKPTQADGAKKMLDKAMTSLKAVREKFAALQLPGENDSDLVKWIVAFDDDSYNYLIKKIDAGQFDKAKAEGLEMYNTPQEAQIACDKENSR